MAKENRGKEIVEEEAPVEEPKKKSKFKWILISSIALVVVASGAFAGYYFLSKTDAKKPAEKPAVVSIWPMDAFVINIAETNGERYLKIVIQLEVSAPSVGPELDQLKPRIRDTILDLL